MITDLRKLAKKNRNYYLAEAKGEVGENKWFRNVKTMDTYSEAVLISPTMAQQLLEADEDSAFRKPVDPAVIRGIAQNLSKGNAPSHEAISISFSGKLLNGRMMLEAIMLNKKSAIVFVSFNVSDKLSFLFG